MTLTPLAPPPLKRPFQIHPVMETFWNSLGYDRSRSPRSVPAFLPRRISVGPRLPGKVREEPQRRERKWGRKLRSQGFSGSRNQDQTSWLTKGVELRRRHDAAGLDCLLTSVHTSPRTTLIAPPKRRNAVVRGRQHPAEIGHDAHAERL